MNSRKGKVNSRSALAIVITAFAVFTVIAFTFMPGPELGSSVQDDVIVDRKADWTDDVIQQVEEIGKKREDEEEQRWQDEKKKWDQLENERNEAKLENTRNIRPERGDGNQERVEDETKHQESTKIDRNDPRKTTLDDAVDDDAENAERAKKIKEAFKHAWFSYKKHAWGTDELKPQSKSGHQWLSLGMTIVDSLDTLWIMDMKDEFEEARDWISKSLNFDRHVDVSVFETNIRILGGLLAAYDLSKDNIFLEKAIDIGDRLLKAFNTPSGIPHASVNLKTGTGRSPGWTGGASILSEVGTMQLEFKYLSHVTGDEKYRNAAQKVIDVLDKNSKNKGLYPVYISTNSGSFTGGTITYGALGDSFYEYLIKQWYQTSKTESQYRRMYDEAMVGLFDHLLKKSSPSNLVYIAESNGAHEIHKMDHLACFAAGMLAMGAKDSADEQKHMEAAGGIADTCYEMYVRQPSGIGAESVVFRNGYDFVPQARYYILRPEAVEAQFVLWRYTHNQKYREQAWKMWEGIDKHCRCEAGFAGIRDVTSSNPVKDDLMQSFFLAETLKYLYLTFQGDDVIDLDKYVFNTEAHPLSVW